MSDTTLHDIGDKLDVLVRLAAFLLTDGKKQREQIRTLSAAGLGPSKIADILGTTPNTVKVETSLLRKSGLLPASKKAHKDEENRNE